MTDEPVVAFKPVAGDHVYPPAPVTLKVVELPAQMVGVVLPTGTGFVPTITCWLAAEEHPTIPTTVTL